MNCNYFIISNPLIFSLFLAEWSLLCEGKCKVVCPNFVNEPSRLSRNGLYWLLLTAGGSKFRLNLINKNRKAVFIFRYYYAYLVSNDWYLNNQGAASPLTKSVAKKCFFIYIAYGYIWRGTNDTNYAEYLFLLIWR